MALIPAPSSSALLLLALTYLLVASAAASSSISRVVSEELYNSIFLHKDDAACPAKGFYTYESFIEAASYFPTFGTTGSPDTRRREVAAFLGQTSHETTGGWPAAPDGPYAWGLCFKEEISPPWNGGFCDPSYIEDPCAPGKSYQGRGPIQLTWNYNYGPAGRALGFDGLNNPDIVATDSVISFKTALWFWMTEKTPKPSCHDVMVGNYIPTPEDVAANRTAGFGLLTNIISDGIECGKPNNHAANDRIGFFQRYANLFNVDTGPNVDCENQKPYPPALTIFQLMMNIAGAVI